MQAREHVLPVTDLASDHGDVHVTAAALEGVDVEHAERRGERDPDGLLRERRIG